MSDGDILIVDDNETNLNLLTRYMLRSGNYTIVTAANGTEALQLVDATRLDLVLLDLLLPDITGAEVLKTIREKHDQNELPVIMLTAKHENEAAIETFMLGANDYITKPYDIKILKARVDTQVKLKRNTNAYQEIRDKLENLVYERTEKLDKLNRTLESERMYFENLLSASPAVTYACDIENKYACTFVSQNLEQITGYKPDEMIRKEKFWVEHLHPEDAKKTTMKIGRNIKAGKGSVEYRFQYKDGKYRWIYDQHRVIYENKKPLRVIGSWTDLSDFKKLEDEISYRNRFSGLTGLINRAEFERKLQHLLEEAVMETGQHIICYMDLDQFKIINNTHGHIAGDQLLKELSKQLSGVLSKRDILAYLGGDEFGILLPHCTLNQALNVVENVRKFIREFRFEWNQKKFSITASIGVVPVNKYTGNSNDILSFADSACYVAKENGRDRVHVYTEDDLSLTMRHTQMRWIEGINRAMEEDRLYLYFQPIIPLKTPSAEMHFELLLRMKDEEGKLVKPGEFLPAAERYNISSKIDQWVIQTAFSWFEVYDELLSSDYLWGINLSGQSLSDKNLLRFVIEEFDNRNIPPDRIYFEITETSAIADFSNAVDFVKKLKKYGCKFALDDFGSGMSSFAYLKNIPVNYLKIDGMFVRDICSNEFDYSIVKSINEVAHALDIKTIAEFVEKKETLDGLKNIGVDYAQGFYIEKPSLLSQSSVEKIARLRSLGA